jgi:hypothetical protein
LLSIDNSERMMNQRLPSQFSFAAILIQLILYAWILSCPAFAYGSSSEDLIGAFSMQKTIKLAGSSECFSSSDTIDPLVPPQSEVAGVGALADDQPPSLAGFDFEPTTISSRSDQTVNLTVHIIDDQSGLWASAAYFAAPSRSQTAMALFRPEARTGGSSKDGVYTAQMRLPKDGKNEIETGYWELLNLTMVDGENNRRVLQADGMVRQGLLVRFLVI